MKKIYELVKPFLLIILGALLLLSYFDSLRLKGFELAIGIIAIVLAVYYIVYGLLVVILGDKVGGGLRKGLDLAAMVLFPAFLFTSSLLIVVNSFAASSAAKGAKKVSDIGISGWIISIITMIASLGFVGVFSAASFLKNKRLNRFASLFGLMFVLALLLNLMFDRGVPNGLGDLSLVNLIIYASFSSYLLSNMGKLEVAGDAAVEEVPPAE